MKLVIVAIGLFLIAAFITRADEQDIKNCMKVTGWSYEKCEAEINT